MLFNSIPIEEQQLSGPISKTLNNRRTVARSLRWLEFLASNALLMLSSPSSSYARTSKAMLSIRVDLLILHPFDRTFRGPLSIVLPLLFPLLSFFPPPSLPSLNFARLLDPPQPHSHSQPMSSSTTPPTPADSGECVVCGQITTTRCSSCASHGTRWMYFCSKEHQKLVSTSNLGIRRKMADFALCSALSPRLLSSALSFDLWRSGSLTSESAASILRLSNGHGLRRRKSKKWSNQISVPCSPMATRRGTQIFSRSMVSLSRYVEPLRCCSRSRKLTPSLPCPLYFRGFSRISLKTTTTMIIL